MRELSSEEPDIEPEVGEEPPPPPPPEEPEQPEPPQKPFPSDDDLLDAWAESYEEHVDAKETPPPKRRKRKRHGGLIVLAIVIIFLVLWTLLSPKVQPEVGDTYLRSQRYASLGGFAGTVDTWAGDVTFALSVSGSSSAAVGAQEQLSVLVTKVSENASNMWFRGTWMSLRNVSLYDADGTYLSGMSNKTDIGFGPVATVPITFSQAGDHEVYVHAKFIVYVDMLIGFVPLKAVQMESTHFTIHVS